IRSPSSVPPGSRTATGSRSASHWPRSSAWVVLPEPSVPSKVMKIPRCPANLGRFFGQRRDAKPALRLLAGAAGGQVVLRHELVLQAAQVRVLRPYLNRPERRLDLANRRRGLGQGSSRRLVLLVDSVNASQGVAHLAHGVALENVD